MSPQAADNVIDLREYVDRTDVTDRDKLRRIARDVEALRVLDERSVQAWQSIADSQVETATTLARVEDSLAATQLYAMRAEATARRLEARPAVVPPPSWNRPVKAAFGLLSAVAVILAGGFAADPRPYLEALERILR